MKRHPNLEVGGPKNRPLSSCGRVTGNTETILRLQNTFRIADQPLTILVRAHLGGLRVSRQLASEPANLPLDRIVS